MLKKCNSISHVEEYLATLPPDQEVTVIADSQFYYIENPGQLIRNWERIVYDGPVKNFQAD